MIAPNFVLFSLYRYPSSEQKTRMAKEIFQTFPSVKETTPGMKGHVSIIEVKNLYFKFSRAIAHGQCCHNLNMCSATNK